VAEQLDTLRSALADHYAIERELGAGGMAIVYLARDLKHDRHVAVKVFRPELAASLGVDRFLREIQVTAKLQHPHILPLYDSGEAGGLLYYVMPYVEGESLADLVAREGQLGFADAVHITREVAEALAHAHSYGIIHRDIKPQNILLSGGHAVVADFGIARAVSEAGGEKLTQTGMAVGTPAYMSPEQAGGDQHVDGRSDIYSLGCVLYEMLVGQIPFTGSTPQAIMARHSIDAVPAPHIVRGSIPDELEDVVLCALEKSPADRFHTAAELVETLNSLDSGTVAARRGTRSGLAPARRRRMPRAVPVAAGAVAAVVLGIAGWQLWPRAAAPSVGGLDPRNVAVLYFEDLSPNGELGYVADGLTEGLIDRLSRVSALSVISRNGVAPYRSGDVPRDSIARALKVGSLIEGTVEKVGDRIRVTSRLVDGNSGADFDRSAFELPASELLVVRDSAAKAVSSFFRKRLGEEIRLRNRRAGTTSVEAWSLVQRAEQMRKDAERLIRSDSTAAGFATFDRADSVLAAAEGADPEWVVAPVLRSEIAYRKSRLVEDLRAMFNWIDIGLEHANRALTIDPNEPQALEIRGTLRYWAYLNDREPDPEEAEKLLYAAKADLEKAVDIDPTLANAHASLSHLYYQTDDGLTSVVLAARTAYEQDAYLTAADRVLSRLFDGHYDLEQFSQAERWCSVGAERFPDDYRFKECQLWILTTPIAEPDVDDAWRIWSELVPLISEPERGFQSRWSKLIVGGILAQAGLADSARNVLVSARPPPGLDPLRELSWLEAYMRVLLGDYDEAIELLKTYLVANPGYEPGPEDQIYWWWRQLLDHPRVNEVRAALIA